MQVRAIPVLFACDGCAEYGDLAREVAALLDERRLVEFSWCGAQARDEELLLAKARSRYPIYSIDGCAKRCVQRWLARHGVRVQRHIVLASPGESATELAERFADDW